MQDHDILMFLEKHPEFLAQHAEQLGLKAGKSTERGVVSLAERQILELKDRNRQLNARLQELMGHAETNDQIIANLHRLSVALQRCASLPALVATLEQRFAQDFALDRMALRLWHPASEAHEALYDSRNEIMALANNLNTPYCGPYVNAEVLSWFPEEPVLESFSQLALRDEQEQCFGLLVLATDDAERFTRDMNTHYLSQTGDLIAAAAWRLLTN